MLFQFVRDILRNECSLPEGSKILAGISGGPDSICMLDILSQLPYQIVVAHLNHNLRPSASSEMVFVEKLSLNYGFKFIGKSIDILKVSKKMRIGIEESARNERYKFLFYSAEIEEAVGVAVAHQADDQVETFLENLLRGAGLEGLTGMKERSVSEFNANIPLIRPLLNIWREDILRYCQNHHLEYKIDETNQSLVHTRSSIRNHLIPELIRYNPSIKNTLFRTQQILSADSDYLDDALAESFRSIWLNVIDGTVELNLKAFKKLPVSLQRLVIKRILNQHFRTQELISFSNIEFTRKLLTREIRKTSLVITDKLIVFISGPKGIFTSEIKNEAKERWPWLAKELTVLSQPGKYQISENWLIEIDEIPRKELSIDLHQNSDAFTGFFDKSQLDEKLIFRTWIKGDRFQPFGMNGKSQKMTDFWINRKIPDFARKSWPLLINKGTIIWIPALQQDHTTRVSESTQIVLALRAKRKVKE